MVLDPSIVNLSQRHIFDTQFNGGYNAREKRLYSKMDSYNLKIEYIKLLAPLTLYRWEFRDIKSVQVGDDLYYPARFSTHSDINFEYPGNIKLIIDAPKGYLVKPLKKYIDKNTNHREILMSPSILRVTYINKSKRIIHVTPRHLSMKLTQNEHYMYSKNKFEALNKGVVSLRTRHMKSKVMDGDVNFLKHEKEFDVERCKSYTAAYLRSVAIHNNILPVKVALKATKAALCKAMAHPKIDKNEKKVPKLQTNGKVNTFDVDRCMKYKVSELKNELKQRKMKVSGRKLDLCERLRRVNKSPRVNGKKNTFDVERCMEYTVNEIKEELRRRRLKVSGRKAELCNRLRL